MQDDIDDAIVSAIQVLRGQLKWKPGSDVRHLAKRKRMEHLPPDATLADYTDLILGVLAAPVSKVYCYDHESTRYGVVVGMYGDRDWLVIFTLQGVLETAFPPGNAQRYIDRRQMRLLGTMEELVT